MSGKDSFLEDARKNIEKAVIMHGYGFMLDETRLRELAAPVPDLCRDFLQDRNK